MLDFYRVRVLGRNRICCLQNWWHAIVIVLVDGLIKIKPLGLCLNFELIRALLIGWIRVLCSIMASSRSGVSYFWAEMRVGFWCHSYCRTSNQNRMVHIKAWFLRRILSDIDRTASRWLSDQILSTRGNESFLFFFLWFWSLVSNTNRYSLLLVLLWFWDDQSESDSWSK